MCAYHGLDGFYRSVVLMVRDKSTVILSQKEREYAEDLYVDMRGKIKNVERCYQCRFYIEKDGSCPLFDTDVYNRPIKCLERFGSICG